MSEQQTKTLGSAIDEIVSALTALPEAVRMTAVRAACESVGLPLAAAATNADAGARLSENRADVSTVGGTGSAEQRSAPQDIRSLKDAKQPRNNQEMACIMAYYLQHMAPTGERKTAVAAGDVEKYFAQAGFPLPKAPGQVLIDTKNAGYFDAVDRGTYKLNPVGHNLVVHTLPRRDGTAPAKSSGAGGPRKTTRKPR